MSVCLFVFFLLEKEKGNIQICKIFFYFVYVHVSICKSNKILTLDSIDQIYLTNVI